MSLRRLRGMFRQPPFAVLVAVLGFLALNWPFAEPARSAGVFPLFLYLFGVWVGIILLALLISRVVVSPDGNGGEDDA